MYNWLEKIASDKCIRLCTTHYAANKDDTSMRHVSHARLNVLKVKKHDENEEQELEFELAYQRTLTTQQRFELMFRKSGEIMEVMLRHGYRKPFEIIKRS